MNPHHNQVATSVPKLLIPMLTLVAAATLVACSGDPKPASQVTQTNAVVPTVAIQSAASTPARAEVSQAVVSRPHSKLLTYNSRDYGVSFQYPWQYAKIGPRAISQGDASLQPKSDGSEGQFPLVRIHVPRSFYPDTNLDSSYFAMSLNQSLDEKSCVATLGSKKPEQVQTATINGLDYKWIETDVVGGGSSEKVRNYVTYANGTCYEVELGLKTTNEQGLAREVDPEQVMRRLNAILQTVKVQSGEVETTVAEADSDTNEPRN